VATQKVGHPGNSTENPIFSKLFAKKNLNVCMAGKTLRLDFNSDSPGARHLRAPGSAAGLIGKLAVWSPNLLCLALIAYFGLHCRFMNSIYISIMLIQRATPAIFAPFSAIFHLFPNKGIFREIKYPFMPAVVT
jgi:hypothetical protein